MANKKQEIISLLYFNCWSVILKGVLWNARAFAATLPYTASRSTALALYRAVWNFQVSRNLAYRQKFKQKSYKFLLVLLIIYRQQVTYWNTLR